MSMPHCYDCLGIDGDGYIDSCTCENPSGKIIYGELRVQYLRGYRDAQEGKEEQI